MGNRNELKDDEFYNRNSELDNLKSLLESTKHENAPNLLLTGIRGVGKTVFLKKIKKTLEEDYLIVYLDFSRAECYQKSQMSVTGLMDYYYKEIIRECERKKIFTIKNRLDKFFKTNEFKIESFSNIGEFPIPIIDNEVKSEELINFSLELPDMIYQENSDKIDGIIILIDEFQVIKELNKYLESFLWKFRSFIQDQSNVAYVLSGSMSLQDQLISDIASQGGVFGGRMMTFHLNPFDKQTVKSYLDEKAPNLLLTDEAFDRFYKCTSGIPAYVNFLGRILPKDIELDEKIIKDEFIGALPILSGHLISTWSKLTLREQDIIISLLDGPKKRIEIADALNISTGSLSYALNNLQNKYLIKLSNGKYQLSEPMLALWLKSEYEKKEIYPYR